MLVLGIKKVEKFVTEQQELGNDVRWDGWTMVFFRPHPAALYAVENNRHVGVWSRKSNAFGFETRVDCDDKGLWSIDYRNVKRATRTTRN